MSTVTAPVRSGCENLMFVDPLGFISPEAMKGLCYTIQSLQQKKAENTPAEKDSASSQQECEQFDQRIQAEFNHLSDQLFTLHAMMSQGHDVKDLIDAANKSHERLMPLLDQYKNKCKDYDTKKRIESLKHTEIDAKLKSTHLHFAVFKPDFDQQAKVKPDKSLDQRVQTVQFPNKPELSACLQHHPLTKNPYWTEKKVIDQVAESFADLDINNRRFTQKVKQATAGAAEKLDLSPHSTQILELSLGKALLDCSGKAIPYPKTTNIGTNLSLLPQ